jgi:hypothetical protein
VKSPKQPAGPAPLGIWRFFRLRDCGHSLVRIDRARFRKHTETHVFKVFAQRNRGTSLTRLVTTRSAAVQPRCIFLQNLAQNEIADPLQSPTDRLGCRLVCTTSGFAQKADAKPVGGRGISAFSVSFFCEGGKFSQQPTVVRCCRQSIRSCDEI